MDKGRASGIINTFKEVIPISNADLDTIVRKFVLDVVFENGELRNTLTGIVMDRVRHLNATDLKPHAIAKDAYSDAVKKDCRGFIDAYINKEGVLYGRPNKIIPIGCYCSVCNETEGRMHDFTCSAPHETSLMVNIRGLVDLFRSFPTLEDIEKGIEKKTVNKAFIDLIQDGSKTSPAYPQFFDDGMACRWNLTTMEEKYEDIVVPYPATGTVKGDVRGAVVITYATAGITLSIRISKEHIMGYNTQWTVFRDGILPIIADRIRAADPGIVIGNSFYWTDANALIKFVRSRRETFNMPLFYEHCQSIEDTVTVAGEKYTVSSTDVKRPTIILSNEYYTLKAIMEKTSVAQIIITNVKRLATSSEAAARATIVKLFRGLIRFFNDEIRGLLQVSTSLYSRLPLVTLSPRIRYLLPKGRNYNIKVGGPVFVYDGHTGFSIPGKVLGKGPQPDTYRVETASGTMVLPLYNVVQGVTGGPSIFPKAMEKVISFQRPCESPYKESMTMQGVQSRSDGRFYPRCGPVDVAAAVSEILNGPSEAERNRSATPSATRSTSRQRLLAGQHVDPYSGLNRRISTEKLVVRHPRTGHWVTTSLVGVDSNRSEGDEKVIIYKVEYGPDTWTIDATDIHPVYRQIRWTGLRPYFEGDETAVRALCMDVMMALEMVGPPPLFGPAGAVEEAPVHPPRWLTSRNVAETLDGRQMGVVFVPREAVYFEIHAVRVMVGGKAAGEYHYFTVDANGGILRQIIRREQIKTIKGVKPGLVASGFQCGTALRTIKHHDITFHDRITMEPLKIYDDPIAAIDERLVELGDEETTDFVLVSLEGGGREMVRWSEIVLKELKLEAASADQFYGVGWRSPKALVEGEYYGVKMNILFRENKYVLDRREPYYAIGAAFPGPASSQSTIDRQIYHVNRDSFLVAKVAKWYIDNTTVENVEDGRFVVEVFEA